MKGDGRLEVIVTPGPLEHRGVRVWWGPREPSGQQATMNK